MISGSDMYGAYLHTTSILSLQVSNALNEEIRRLSVLVDEFNEPFHPDPLVLNVYKKTLHAHVESGLGSNLRARLSSALALNIESSQAEMTSKFFLSFCTVSFISI